MGDNDITKELPGSQGPSGLLHGRYEIERELGRGGMSVVYLAKDRQLANRRVVVKLLLEESNKDDYVRRKFNQEMEALSRIGHPGVVEVLDFGSLKDGKQFLVMQFVPGDNLRKTIPEQGGMEPARVADLITQVASALAAAHEKDILHRDIKPENIMIKKLPDGREHVVLIDFGIAGIKNSAFGATGTKIAGSLSYMAPEHFAGEPVAASDQFATAVIAFEMLTGRKPWEGQSMSRFVDAKVAAPPSARQLGAAISEEVESVLAKGLAFRPEDRYAKISEFSEALKRALVPPASSTQETRRAQTDGLQMAHVLFMDLIGFSTLPMESQRSYLRDLQQYVRACPAFQEGDAAGNIVSLPTGDGMALAFFGDPTAPARCALEIGSQLRVATHLKLRMGIHSGPVYRVADINTNSNVAGGGINLAQRVMDAAENGHILVSKTVADTLTQVGGWGDYLFDLGQRTVKHGVQMHLYNLVSADAGNMKPPSWVGTETPVPTPAPPPRPPEPEPSRRGLLYAGAAVAAVLAGVAVWSLSNGNGGGGKPVVKPGVHGFNYSIWVQRKAAEGKPAPPAFKLSKEMLFQEGHGMAIEITTPEPGHLYAMNEGIDAKKARKTIVVMHPREGRASRAEAGAIVRIPNESYFEFDSATGKEAVSVVWSKEPVTELEALLTLPVSPDTGVITLETPEAMGPVLAFLAKNEAQATLKENEEARHTEVRSASPIVVHTIKLEHH